MNKERFHNALALSLGYERIVKDKRVDIMVEDGEEPWVVVKIQGSPNVIRIKASDATTIIKTPAMQDEINAIADAVHHAYTQAITNKLCTI